jgi:glycosyltransferase involved in cell wall biosynthesis
MALKVLLVTEASSAGVGRHVLDLSAGLIARGCEVHLVYSPLRIDATFSATVAQLEALRCKVVHMKRGPHPTDLSVVWRLRCYVSDNGPFDVIHAHSSKAGIVVRLGGRNLRKAKIVYTPHCIYTMNPTSGWLAFHLARGIERFLLPHTNAVVAVSPEEEAHLLKLGFDRHRVYYIPNGIYPQNWRERNELRRELGVKDETVLIGFLGRFSTQKNPLLMISAFAEAAGRHPEAMLAMTGEGPLGAETKALAARLGLGERVRWLGYRRPGDILPALDIFALTSAYEALPYVLLEALCAGLPIVSTAVGGVSVTVTQGHNGIVVAAQEVGEFADALDSLISDNHLRRRMAKASRDKARTFATDRMVDETLDLYHARVTSAVHILPVRV